MSGMCWTALSYYYFNLFLVGILFTTTVVICGSNNNHVTREILVKLNSEEKLSFLQSQSQRFGLEYKEKVSKHVYSFRERSSPLKKKDIDAFRQFFSAEIAEIQEVRYCPVHTYPRWGITSYSREERFATYNLFKRKKQCSPYFGMGIEEAWSLNFTGVGVNIGILDVGVEMNHLDLKQNINAHLGYNFVDEANRHDFTPRYNRNYFEADQMMDHGNNIAGLIAAVKGNDLCSGGVAYSASIIPLVVFKLQNAMMWNNPDFNDRYIARALAHKNQDIHIYSNSYSNTCSFLRPRISMQDSLITGTKEGRQGKGSIFVFSLGDKAYGLHDGNMDFFANSIYTITIGSVAKGGHVPDYSIPCACIIASAPSEGNTLDADNFLTTSHQGSCTNKFKGNSAATGIGAAIISLGLQDKLSWRDVQYLLIYTSTLDGLTPRLDSTINGVGLKYNPHFGYGIINATAFALAAQTWVPVSPQISTTHIMTSRMRLEPKTADKFRALVVNVQVKMCGNAPKCIHHIEHVVAQLNYAATRERILSIQLCSPLNTCSYLLNDAYGTLEITDEKIKVRRTWNFTSVQFWGESPNGNWTLIMMQHDRMKNESSGNFTIRNLTLYIYGTPQNSTNRNNIYLQGRKTACEECNGIIQKIRCWIQSPEELEDNFFIHFLEGDAESIVDNTKNGKDRQYLYGLLIFFFPLAVLSYQGIKRFLCQRNSENRIYTDDDDDRRANEDNDDHDANEDNDDHGANEKMPLR